MTAPSITPRDFYKTLDADSSVTYALAAFIKDLFRLQKKTGCVFAKDTYLSRVLKKSVRSVQRHLKKAEELGYIQRHLTHEKTRNGFATHRAIYTRIPDSKNVSCYAKNGERINTTEQQISSYEGKENFWKKRTIQRGKTATRRRVALATFQDILNLNLSQAEVKLTTLISQTPQLNFLTPHNYYQMLKRYGWEFLKQVCCEFMSDIQRNWRFIKSPEAIFFSKIKNWRQIDGD